MAAMRANAPHHQHAQYHHNQTHHSLDAAAQEELLLLEDSTRAPGGMALRNPFEYERPLDTVNRVSLDAVRVLGMLPLLTWALLRATAFEVHGQRANRYRFSPRRFKAQFAVTEHD